MATRITVVLEDDLEGGPADEMVQFGIGGTYYEIDLNASNAAAFRPQLAPCIEHGCRTGGEQRQRPGALRPAGHGARTSGPGPKNRASRSATAGASPATSPGSTEPPREDADAGLTHR
jgi:Lsr2